MENNFYLELNSSHSLHFNDQNHGGEFQIHFGQPLRLNGAWEVALVELHYPMTMFHIREPNNLIKILDRKKTTKLYIPEGYYSNITVFLDCLNNMLMKFMHFAYNI